MFFAAIGKSLILTGLMCLFLFSSICYAEQEQGGTALESLVEITVQEAVLMALENNRAFRVERLNPDIMKTYEIEQESQFDSVLSAGSTYSESTLASGIVDNLTKMERRQFDGELSKRFSTGTTVSAGVAGENMDSTRYTANQPPSSSITYSAQGKITVNQPLLQGFGRAVNLASLERARASTNVSEYQLRGFAESLVADVETTCWDYILRQRRIKIYEDSLRLAEDQLSETRQRVDIGRLARVELYAAQAEVALRREALINAKSDLALTELRLKRLLNLADLNAGVQNILISDEPVVVDAHIDEASEHVNAALKMRPEVNQARLEIKRGEMETVRTKNGILPLLDFFITLGKTGYSDSFQSSFDKINDSKYDISAGLSFEFPLKNRADKARHERAVLGVQQAEEALSNLEQLVEMDVRSALIEVNRAQEQVAATAATRRLQEESLRAETEKFRVGKSTALLVARAQRDYLASQIEEINTVITCIKAITYLYQNEGTLLERRGISTPGNR